MEGFSVSCLITVFKYACGSTWCLLQDAINISSYHPLSNYTIVVFPAYNATYVQSQESFFNQKSLAHLVNTRWSHTCDRFLPKAFFSKLGPSPALACLAILKPLSFLADYLIKHQPPDFEGCPFRVVDYYCDRRYIYSLMLATGADILEMYRGELFMGTLLYWLIVGASFAVPPLIARLILSTFYPRFWSYRFARGGLYCALLCLSYVFLEALTFSGDVHIPEFSLSAVKARASYAEFYSAEGALYSLVRLKRILDRFFPLVFCPAMLVTMAIYVVDRSQQVSRSKS
jgi:hypothetical protein